MMTVQEHVSLAPLSTFRIGGLARFFVSVTSEEELLEALRYAQKHSLQVCVLGGGSNILFSDRGFDGLIVKMDYREENVDGTKVSFGCGIPLLDAVNKTIGRGLAGMELLAGIPGTLGGAVRGNAGAFGTEIGSLVTRVHALDSETFEKKVFERDACGFGYRQSIFKQNPQLLVLSVEMALSSGEKESLIRIASETIAKREAKHPQTAACAGSFFMNPFVTDEKLLAEFALDTGVASRKGVLPAGWIIDHVGLRGKRVGGAQVSERHPNYLVNTGGASAEDVIILASIVKQRVRTQLGIRLKEEIQMVGF